MQPGISFDREQETPEAKARWFQSLSIEERMELFCAYTDLILSARPRIADLKDAEQASERIRILSKEDLIISNQAAGRPRDLEDVRALQTGGEEA
ncbi:MAG: hypothetical protein HY718_02440 [Planctomycetes bacterium]|nr:hypothetical protein [Planctomycetota bacterium]